jgi:hypothetical protein
VHGYRPAIVSAPYQFAPDTGPLFYLASEASNRVSISAMTKAKNNFRGMAIPSLPFVRRADAWFEG